MDYNGKDDEMVDKPVDESIDNITGRLTPTKKYGDHSLDGVVNLPRAGPESSIRVKNKEQGFGKRISKWIKSYFIPVVVVAGTAGIFGYHILNPPEENISKTFLPPKSEINSEKPSGDIYGVHPFAEEIFEVIRSAQRSLYETDREP